MYHEGFTDNFWVLLLSLFKINGLIVFFVVDFFFQFLQSIQFVDDLFDNVQPKHDTSYNKSMFSLLSIFQIASE